MKTSHTVFTLGNVLTEEQKNFFEQYGYLHFRQFISREKVAEVLEDLRRVEEYILKNGIKRIRGVPLKFGYDIDQKPIVQRLAFTSLFSPVVAQILSDKRLEALFALLGCQQNNCRIGTLEKDGVVYNHYVHCANSGFSRLGWHTDALRDVFYFKKLMPMLNVGLHLDDFPAIRGGLRLIPGTHNQSTWHTLFRKKYFISHQPDPEEIGLDILAGDLTVHDGRLWHRVERSSVTGEESRRRVMYIPFVTGKFKPRKENARPKLYQYLYKFVR
ncbi:MAG: phytanoyl-CoA dioxygenase family protein [Flavobacteriales bacterium]|nr:phytanoyl-CoA dioxygenase family protein [Flavobacteriales bacterium]MCX7767752.1 phytanoyl-CoA dioxygenase family protein [Flavobacteriales bacterium]MDW8409353.1 phytanoyl-CoA dioxygenase family protein [Flavobacteriales bacterium]